MKNLDASLDYMENARFNYLYAPIISKMEKKSLFTQTELLCIVMIFHKFVLMNGPRAKYMTIIQLSKLCEVLFHILDRDINTTVVSRISHFDKNNSDPKFSYDSHCSLTSFIHMFHIFFTDDLEMRMRFAFSVYDKGERGYLDQETVARGVVNFFPGEDEDETFELRTDMVELLFMKFDLDKDTLITEDEYIGVVRDQPDLMEFLGRVFPSVQDLDIVATCANILSWFDNKDDSNV